MTIHSCPRCGYETKQSFDFKKHLERKKLCDPTIADISLDELKKKYLLLKETLIDCPNCHKGPQAASHPWSPVWDGSDRPQTRQPPPPDHVGQGWRVRGGPGREGGLGTSALGRFWASILHMVSSCTLKTAMVLL